MNDLIEDIRNRRPVDVPEIIPRDVELKNPQLYIPHQQLPQVVPPDVRGIGQFYIPHTYTPLCQIGDTNCYGHKFFTDLLYTAPHKFVMVGNNPILHVGGFYYKKFGINNNVYIVRSPHNMLRLTPQDHFVIINSEMKNIPANPQIQGDVAINQFQGNIQLLPVPQNLINVARILPTNDLANFAKYLKYKNKYYALKKINGSI